MVAVWPTGTVALDPPFTRSVGFERSGAVASAYSFNLATAALELPL
jgi:hypothetical protein